MIFHGNNTNYKPAPAGAHQAVCVDWTDLGMVPTQWGPKHKVRVVFQIAAVNPETGRRFTVRKSMNALLSKGSGGKRNSALYDILVQWRGRDYSEEEMEAGVDPEVTIGANAMIFVTHKPGENGQVYADLTGISPVQPGTPLLTAADYVREKDRQGATPTAPAPAPAVSAPVHGFVPPPAPAPAAVAAPVHNFVPPPQPAPASAPLPKAPF